MRCVVLLILACANIGAALAAEQTIELKRGSGVAGISPTGKGRRGMRAPRLGNAAACAG